MGVVILLLALLVIVAVGPFKPKIAVCSYYFMSIMAPQAIWSWVFSGVPAFSIVAGSLLLAFLLSLLTKKINLSSYRDKQNIALIMLFILVHLGNWFSPFDVGLTSITIDLYMGTFNTIVLIYFVSLPFLSNENVVKWVTGTFVSVVLYYVYWSNNEYFSYTYANFNQGRLMGPVNSPYRDENKFSVLFVLGMPFFLFGVFYFKKTYMKVACGIALLLLWHSIFLTGSRGALLAISISTLFAYRLIKSKAFGWLLIIGFVVIVIDQGSQSFERSSETISAAQDELDKPIDPRISSWTAGLGFMGKHPFLGVGITKFRVATTEYYPDKAPYVAHNTYINIAAESGLISGFIFIYFYILNYLRFKQAIKEGIERYPFLDYLNKAGMTALTGFYVTAVFLDLLIYEAFYLMLMLMFAKDALFRKVLELNDNERKAIDSI